MPIPNLKNKRGTKQGKKYTFKAFFRVVIGKPFHESDIRFHHTNVY